MSVDWKGYEPYDPGVRGPLHALPPGDARQAFERLMQAKDQRVHSLRSLLERNGIILGNDRDSIIRLNRWFVEQVERDPRNPGRLQPIWYSVVNDIALFIGDVVRERAPSVHWAFFDKGKADLAYQRHVLMGFRRVPNPKYYVDIDTLVAQLGHRAAAGSTMPGDERAFQAWIDSATAKA